MYHNNKTNENCNESIQPAASVVLQPKLSIGAVNDPLEHEADAVADKVMRMPEPKTIQRKCDHCEEEEKLQRKPLASFIQRKESSTGTVASDAVSNQINTGKGSGSSMDSNTQSFMQSRFGAGFSDVKIHTGGEAIQMNRELSARAFTVGNDIYFNEGQYNPDSGEGKHLLAHELTHVIQQSQMPTGMIASSFIQRALTCDIAHITTECGNAAATCAAIQGSYCSKKYPDAKSIDDLHKNAIAGAKSNSKDIPEAAANLLYYLAGTGGDKLMPVAIFRNHQATKDQLTDVHRAKFITGAKKRLADGRLKPGGSVTMEWTDTANAFDFSMNDLGLAVGGYTLCSNVTVSAKDAGGGKIELSFDKWMVQAFDCYNWDPGKGIGGMFGGVTDNDLCCLENAKKASHFQIHTDPWKNTHTPSMGKETISTATPAPTPAPSKPGGSKEDDSR